MTSNQPYLGCLRNLAAIGSVSAWADPVAIRLEKPRTRGLMLRLVIIILVVLGGAVRPATALPDEWSRAVIQLADAAGVLSSRSCRDGVHADRAAQVLSHLLNQASQNKHLNYAEWREYRRKWVIPSIQATRGLSHSSRDCDAARKAVGMVIVDWKVPEEIATRSASADPVGTPDDGSLPAGPILGAASSDRLHDRASQ